MFGMWIKNGPEFQELPAIRFVWLFHFHCFSSRIRHLFEQNPLVPTQDTYSCAHWTPTQSAKLAPSTSTPLARPGSGTNAAGRTHVHIQWCNRNWSRAPALHFGSEFSERNCSMMHALLVLKHLLSSWMSRRISVTCWAICYCSYPLAVGKCISHPLHYPTTLHNNNMSRDQQKQTYRSTFSKNDFFAGNCLLVYKQTISSKKNILKNLTHTSRSVFADHGSYIAGSFPLSSTHPFYRVADDFLPLSWHCCVGRLVHYFNIVSFFSLGTDILKRQAESTSEEIVSNEEGKIY